MLDGISSMYRTSGRRSHPGTQSATSCSDEPNDETGALHLVGGKPATAILALEAFVGGEDGDYLLVAAQSIGDDV